MFRLLLAPALFATLAMLTAASPASAQARVRIDTSLGPIVVELAEKAAPITAANFLVYVDRKRFDNRSFYRAARNPRLRTTGLIQGGTDRNVKGAPLPIAHEPTSKTGLKHLDGTISMARNAPGSAMGDFFITIGAAPYLDAREGNPGYAAFGRVVSGMAVVRKILALPTHPGGRSEATKGQSIKQPVKIITARRVK